jgi:murein DD-endopeptidase MepM/ murein hydrolase activator NlpD
MVQKRPARRTVMWKVDRRDILLKAALLLVAIGLVCIAFKFIRGPEEPMFGEGSRYVPDILPVSLEAGWVSSEFGMRVHPVSGQRRMHTGIDLAVDEGVPVKAAADGKVIFAGDGGGYGNLVKIDHGNGIETRYAHNSVLKVKAGDSVKRGQVVSLAGHSGVATGDHLHYEVRVDGEPVNPRDYLPKKIIEGGRRQQPDSRETNR